MGELAHEARRVLVREEHVVKLWVHLHGVGNIPRQLQNDQVLRMLAKMLGEGASDVGPCGLLPALRMARLMSR